MPSSEVVITWKNTILSELQNDSEIVNALNVHDDEDAENLIWNRLLPHYYHPDTQEKVKTYIFVEIDISTVGDRYDPSKYSLYSYPMITFIVLSHQKDMQMNMTGVSATRTDYLAALIDKKYNGRDGFGLGRLRLKSNTAGNLNEQYKFRELVFETTDLNADLC